MQHYVEIMFSLSYLRVYTQEGLFWEKWCNTELSWAFVTYFDCRLIGKTSNYSSSKKILTLLFNLTNLFHGFLQDCTFVRLDIEVVDVIEVCENQLCKLLYVLIFMFPVTFFSASFGTVKRNTKIFLTKKQNYNLLIRPVHALKSLCSQ